jgi:Tol biopolymer transport system component/DNA-binding winged helix-turn-helix (wHTH) protein
METSSVSQRIARFGVFNVDLGVGELRKNGVRIRLQEQPFQVLAMLLERPGQVVTREELRQKLWSNDTFVDFDHGLNIAVNKIRRALGDSADNPRFLETIPRRGYRFIASVEQVGRTGQIQQVPTAGKLVARSDLHASVAEQHLGNEKSQRRRWWTWAGLACLAGLLLAVFRIFWLQPPQVPAYICGFTQISNDRRPKVGPLLTDSERIYFSQVVGSQYAVSQIAMIGGETVSIATPFSNGLAIDISLKRSELLVASVASTEGKCSLWSLPLPGGPPRPLSDIHTRDAAYSPDGDQIVYAQGQELYLISSDGGQRRALVSLAGRPYWPRWSPDGRKLRFSVEKPESKMLWEIRSDGTQLHPLLPDWNDPPAECCGSWTADGKYFLFQSSRNRSTNLWAIRETRGLTLRLNPQPIQLTAGPIQFERPAASRDGKRLFAVGTQPRGELVRYDDRTEQFLPYLSGLSADHLDFSRDGNWVTYASYPDRTIWRSKLDGSERLQLSFPPMEAILPRWSPDGKKVAFNATMPGRPWKIYTVLAQGGTPQQLMSEERNEFDFGWLPHGDSLVFGLLADVATKSSGKLGIYQLDLRSRQVCLLPGSEGLFVPHCSPDGRYIDAMTADGHHLMLFDASTRHWMELTDQYVDNRAWSRDGKYLYFDTFFEKDPAVARVRMTDRKIERVANLKDVRRDFPPGGPWGGLSLDGAPIVVRDASIQEIYALDWQAP